MHARPLSSAPSISHEESPYWFLGQRRSLWETLRWQELPPGESRCSLWEALFRAEQRYPRAMAVVAVVPGVLFVAGGAVLTQTHGHVPVLAGISFAVGAVWLLGATLHVRANCEEVRSRDQEWNDRL